MRDAMKVFDEILAGLDDDRREVYLLAEIEDCTGPEIAEALGIPVGTAASRSPNVGNVASSSSNVVMYWPVGGVSSGRVAITATHGFPAQ